MWIGLLGQAHCLSSFTEHQHENLLIMQWGYLPIPGYLALLHNSLWPAREAIENRAGESCRSIKRDGDSAEQGEKSYDNKYTGKQDAWLATR